MAAARIVVVRVEPQATSGNHERARHPARLQAKEAASGVDGILNLRSIDHSLLSKKSGRIRTIQPREGPQQASATASGLFHSNKRGATGSRATNSITTLLF